MKRSGLLAGSLPPCAQQAPSYALHHSKICKAAGTSQGCSIHRFVVFPSAPVTLRPGERQKALSALGKRD